jgi:hypothetical protein
MWWLSLFGRDSLRPFHCCVCDYRLCHYLLLRRYVKPILTPSMYQVPPVVFGHHYGKNGVIYSFYGDSSPIQTWSQCLTTSRTLCRKWTSHVAKKCLLNRSLRRLIMIGPLNYVPVSGEILSVRLVLFGPYAMKWLCEGWRVHVFLCGACQRNSSQNVTQKAMLQFYLMESVHRGTVG